MIGAGKIHSISVSTSKGDKKHNVDRATLVVECGITGDAHAGSERQVSLLPLESFAGIQKVLPNLRPGDFAENITTRGIDLLALQLGSRIKLGDSAEIETAFTRRGVVELEVVGIGTASGSQL